MASLFFFFPDFIQKSNQANVSNCQILLTVNDVVCGFFIVVQSTKVNVIRISVVLLAILYDLKLEIEKVPD